MTFGDKKCFFFISTWHTNTNINTNFDDGWNWTADNEVISTITSSILLIVSPGWFQPPLLTLLRSNPFEHPSISPMVATFLIAVKFGFFSALFKRFLFKKNSSFVHYLPPTHSQSPLTAKAQNFPSYMHSFQALQLSDLLGPLWSYFPLCIYNTNDIFEVSSVGPTSTFASGFRDYIGVIEQVGSFDSFLFNIK